MEQHPSLQAFIEEILKRDLETVRAEIKNVGTRLEGTREALSERIQSVRDTATALLPELMRRLEELNNERTRRQAQETSDRERYATTNTVNDFRTGVEKELKSLAGLPQAVGELRERVNASDSRITVIDRALNQGAGERAQQTGERQQQKADKQERAWILPLAISIIANVIFFALTRWLK